MKTEDAMNQALFEILKVGDMVKVASGNEIRVAKKNRKTIVSDMGTKWSYSELHLDGERGEQWKKKTKEILEKNP